MQRITPTRALLQKIIRRRAYYASAFREVFNSVFFEKLGRDRVRFLNERWVTILQTKKITQKNTWAEIVSDAAKKIFDQLDIAAITKIGDGDQVKFINAEIRYSIGKIFHRTVHSSAGSDIFQSDSALFEKFSDSIIEATEQVLLRLLDSSEIEASDDPSEIQTEIDSASKSAPVFTVTRGRIRYKSPRVEGRSFKERKALLRECCDELAALCSARSNEQPELKNLIDKYSVALARVRKDTGAFRLLIFGFHVEIFLKVRAEAPKDLERNHPLDGDLLHKVHAFLVAHAAFIALFDDIRNVPEELDRYRRQMESIEALNKRILDPAIAALAGANTIFDDSTHEVNIEFKRLNEVSKNAGEQHMQGVVAAQHSWLRGVLSAIGNYMLRQARRLSQFTGKTLAEEAIKGTVEKSGLFRTIGKFLQDNQDAFLQLADRLKSSFGWIRSLLSYLGII